MIVKLRHIREVRWRRKPHVAAAARKMEAQKNAAWPRCYRRYQYINRF